MIRYELHTQTGFGGNVRGFEVCAFALLDYCEDGTPMDPQWCYVLRRHVVSIEEAAWLLRVPIEQAQASLVGVGPA